MNTIMNLMQKIQWEHYIPLAGKTLLLFVIGWVLMILARKSSDKLENHLMKKRNKEGEPPSESGKRVETLTRLIRQGVYVFIWLIIGLIFLREMGVDIAPILASAGILGLAVGFGAQNLVRDIISGFFIILENQVRVNDVAIINGTGGLVERINFRTLILRDLSGVVHVFPNGSITTLSNLTRGWSAYVFDIGVAYKENTDEVVDILKEVGKEMKVDSYFGALMLEDLEIFGVDKFASSAVTIKGRIKTKPIRQWETGREFLRRVKHAFDENNIEIPFPHQTIYFGEKSKPFEIEVLEKLKGNATGES